MCSIWFAAPIFQRMMINQVVLIIEASRRGALAGREHAVVSEAWAALWRQMRTDRRPLRWHHRRRSVPTGTLRRPYR